MRGSTPLRWIVIIDGWWNLGSTSIQPLVPMTTMRPGPWPSKPQASDDRPPPVWARLIEAARSTPLGNRRVMQSTDFTLPRNAWAKFTT